MSDQYPVVFAALRPPATFCHPCGMNHSSRESENGGPTRRVRRLSHPTNQKLTASKRQRGRVFQTTAICGIPGDDVLPDEAL